MAYVERENGSQASSFYDWYRCVSAKIDECNSVGETFLFTTGELVLFPLIPFENKQPEK